MDEQLKKRMLGASIIIVLLVIIVPMFFEDKSKPLSEVNALALPEAMDEKAADMQKTARDTEAPEATSGQPVEKKTVLKKGYTVVPLDDTAPKSKTVSKAETAEPNNSSLEGAPSAQEALEAPAEPVSSSPPPSKPAAVSNSVPVKPAAVASARIAEPNKASKSLEVQPKKPVPQVAVAPAPVVAPKPKSSVAAPAVTPPRPQEAVVAKTPVLAPAKAPTTQPLTAASTYLVQAGSFSTENNAKLLVERLKKKNLPAQMSVAQTANGPVYRVTVGPNLNRAKAEQIQKEMAEQDGVKGMIMQAH